MRLAIEAAKFSPADADGLRRCMATFRNEGDLNIYRDKFVGGMTSRGYPADFVERCFEQIKGFGSYGFPESHAASFAKLVYASAWVKCFYPDVFCAALLNSQPMGFYQPAQLVRDAREHGVEVREPDILFSEYDSTLEPASDPSAGLKALRLGLRQVKGFKDDKDRTLTKQIIAARESGARSLQGIAEKAKLSRRALELLAEADAFRSTGLSRREALWAVKGLAPELNAATAAPLMAGLPLFEAAAALPVMNEPQEVTEDYRTYGLSLRRHPCAYFRRALDEKGCAPAKALPTLKDGARVAVAGLVLIRQRPGTAKNVTFLTLEDETGPLNVVIWQRVFEAHRRMVMTSSMLLVKGTIQSESGVIHVVAEGFEDLTPHLAKLRAEPDAEAAGPPPQMRSRVSGRLVRSRDFH